MRIPRTEASLAGDFFVYYIQKTNHRIKVFVSPYKDAKCGLTKIL